MQALAKLPYCQAEFINEMVPVMCERGRPWEGMVADTTIFVPETGPTIPIEPSGIAHCLSQRNPMSSQAEQSLLNTQKPCLMSNQFFSKDLDFGFENCLPLEPR